MGREKEDRKMAGSEWEGKRKTESSILCVGRQKEDTELAGSEWESKRKTGS